MSSQGVAAPGHLHRVKRVKNHRYVRDGSKSYAHLLRKYNIKPSVEGPFDMVDELQHPKGQGVIQRMQNRIAGRPNHVSHRRLVKKDVTSGEVGEVSAQDIQNDSEYLAQCWSTELPMRVQSEGKADKHNIYNHALSHTYKSAPGEKWNITYGDGSSASGNVGTDVVNLGGVMIHNQAVEMAETLSSEFQSGAGDGLVGLAFGSINTCTPQTVHTPMENMIAQSAIPANCELFTAHLGSVKDTNDPDHGLSYYTFGFIDQTALQSNNATINDIFWAPVDKSNGFWQVASSGYTINGQSYPTVGDSAIMDTGTTLAMVDSQTCKNIYAAIPGAKVDNTQGGYVFPSNTASSSLPTVSFDIGGKQFSINKEDLAYAPVGSGWSFGAIQDRGDMPFSIYGDTVLKNVYAIFDLGRTRFGAIQRVDPDISTQSAVAACGPCGSCQSCQ